MKKLFFACAAIALMAGPVIAQDKAAADKKKVKKEATCQKGADAACCKPAQTAQNKSCCMPSKAAGLKTAAAAKKQTKPAPKG
ncbi:hypothetical protein DLD77_06995 [Chitinophaga alhagiae]|uniref:Phosphate starvation-inducible protein PsiF n=1 Tax=Chitinophaga alhagiae TaxID=2203219 RepID=A0ABM6WC09_9BACT|nr:hypothetical protein [Chitinophaga alhagiae]AWO01454.1 hypothetical protein DLD77_06995 [Chitinophaga alhagiae]